MEYRIFSLGSLSNNVFCHSIFKEIMNSHLVLAFSL